MNSKPIDGKILAIKHEDVLKTKLAKIRKERNPMVVSFCNQDDPASQKYTFMKLQKATDLGIDFIAEEFSADTPQEKLIELVKKYSENSEVDGILVQLPLPEELNPFKGEILNLIPAEKDVDGLREMSPFLPATVKAVISILNGHIEQWNTKNIAVVGATGEVGKPLVEVLQNKGVKLVGISSNMGSVETDLADADIIISAVGIENLIKAEMIKNGVVLIDVGLGDFDPGCYEKAGKYTPVTGGVGPMTVISLMENVVESYEKRMVK